MPVLTVYRRKRNFAKTRERKGASTGDRQRLIFVVQKHRASHLHYDLRQAIVPAAKTPPQ